MANYDSEDPFLIINILATIAAAANNQSSSDYFTLAVKLLDFLNFYYLAIIILLGIVGNTLNFLVFTQTHLKLRSSSYYLAALALADIGFLLSLLVVWLDHIGIDLFNRQGFCQATVYGSSVFSCLSVWLTVAYTFERLIAVQYPLQRTFICTVRRAKIIIGVLTFLTLSLHIYSLFTAGISSSEEEPDYSSCGLLPYYFKAMHIVNLVDTVVTLVIPLILILVMNALIAKNLYVFSRTFSKPPVAQHRSIAVRMKHLQDPEDPSQPTNDAHQGPDNGHHHESGLCCDNLFPSENNNSSSQQQQETLTTTRKNKSSSRTTLNRLFQLEASQQRGSTPDAFADGSADEPSVNNQRIELIGTTIGTNSPHPNSVAHQLNQMTTLHQEAAVEFTGISSGPKHTEEKLHHRNILSIGVQHSITKMLLLISTVFITLNMPSYVIRLQVFVKDVMATNSTETSSIVWLLQQFFMLLYYTNFSINFLLYSTCGTTFRHCLCRLLRDKANAIRKLVVRLIGICSCSTSSSE